MKYKKHNNMKRLIQFIALTALAVGLVDYGIIAPFLADAIS